MSTKPARFEVHTLPLAAIDAVLQICRFSKIETPYGGVNVHIVKGEKKDMWDEDVWWAHVEYAGKRWSVTLRIENYQGVTGAIFDTCLENRFFTLGVRDANGCYRITQERTAPFGHGPFSAEDFSHHSDEVPYHHRRTAE